MEPKSEKLLDSFSEYCKCRPHLRFFQALVCWHTGDFYRQSYGDSGLSGVWFYDPTLEEIEQMQEEERERNKFQD